MTEKFVVDVGAQHLGDPRLVVAAVGTDDQGRYAAVAIGSHPHAAHVRLRVGRPLDLGDGRALHLVDIAPEGYRPSVALMVSDGAPDGPAVS